MWQKVMLPMLIWRWTLPTRHLKHGVMRFQPPVPDYCLSWQIWLRSILRNLAQILTLDNGKPLLYSRHECGAAAHILRHFAGFATKVEGRQVPVSGAPNGAFLNYTCVTLLACVGLIVPWNFPLTMVYLETCTCHGGRLYRHSKTCRANPTDCSAFDAAF